MKRIYVDPQGRWRVLGKLLIEKALKNSGVVVMMIIVVVLSLSRIIHS
jgi:hypothetical protein